MKNFAIGFLLGAAAVAAVTWLSILPTTRSNYRAVGQNDGLIAARDDIANQVIAELGTDLDRTESQKILFNVKHRTVVVVDRQGVKTLRTVE